MWKQDLVSIDFETYLSFYEKQCQIIIIRRRLKWYFFNVNQNLKLDINFNVWNNYGRKN